MNAEEELKNALLKLGWAPPQKFTIEKPVAAGYYWYRKNKESGKTIVFVDITPERDVAFCENFGWRFHYRNGWYDLDTIDGEWCGPISHPKDDDVACEI